MKKFFILSLFILLMVQIPAKEINISELSMEEKIAQMIIVRGDNFDERYTRLGIGAIYLSKKKTREEYINLINKYQKSSEIKLLVSADMEGYWNPFPFFKSKNFGEINSKQEAYILGSSHSKILKELGFNLDFSPVVERKNNVWPGRSFTGSDDEIKEKISGYIKGLQENGILATAKHYPGGSMIKDPHKFKYKYNLEKSDLELFDHAIKENVSAIMVGHPIVSGELESKGKQSTISPEVISYLKKDFDGLVISDEISMWGLKISYLFNSEKIYIDLINAGNDMIIDASPIFFPYHRIKSRINEVLEAVEDGLISGKRINESVEKILRVKGYSVIF